MSMNPTAVTVRFRVPAWNYCNLPDCYNESFPDQSARCRFCVEATVVPPKVPQRERGRMGHAPLARNGKPRKVLVCALYNHPLDLKEGVLIRKCGQCVANTGAWKPEPVADEPLYESRFHRDYTGGGYTAPHDDGYRMRQAHLIEDGDEAVSLIRRFMNYFKNYRDKSGYNEKVAQNMAEIDILNEMEGRPTSGHRHETRSASTTGFSSSQPRHMPRPPRRDDEEAFGAAAAPRAGKKKGWFRRAVDAMESTRRDHFESIDT